MKPIKKLTWKYFLEEKWEEIRDFFSDNYGFFAFGMIVFGVFLQVGWATDETGLPTCKPLAIIGLCFVGFWILIGFITLIKVICKWINSNWKKAKQKARKELKK